MMENTLSLVDALDGRQRAELEAQAIEENLGRFPRCADLIAAAWRRVDEAQARCEAAWALYDAQRAIAEQAEADYWRLRAAAAQVERDRGE